MPLNPYIAERFPEALTSLTDYQAYLKTIVDMPHLIQEISTIGSMVVTFSQSKKPFIDLILNDNFCSIMDEMHGYIYEPHFRSQGVQKRSQP